MARKGTTRLALGALLAGGMFGGFVLFDRTGAGLEANARQSADSLATLAHADPKPLELAAVEVIKVEPSSMAERFRVSGALRPVERVVLRSKAAGTVTEVNGRAGQHVRAGDLLVRFETEELIAALAQYTSNFDGATAELVRAEQALARVDQLAQKNISSIEQLEKAHSEVAAARAKSRGLAAQIDIAKTALRNAEIKAPFDGVVASRVVDPGAAIAASTELMTVVDMSALEAEMLVSTRDVSRLRLGNTAELHIDGLDGQLVTGRVDRINPVANDGSRFVPVYIRLENPQGSLWGGMFATGTILVRESKDTLVLPATSLREDDQGEFVLKLDDGRLVRQAVTVRSSWDGGSNLELVGLRRGDVIVTSPLAEFRPGIAVIVAEAG